jgi:RsmE family RNA methyltransferase
MIRLHVPDDLEPGARIALGPEPSRYLLAVMRQGVGDALLVFNGRHGEWRAVVTEAGKRGAVLTAEARTREQRARPDLDLLIALVKRARLETIVEKATELGVARVRLVLTRRTQSDHTKLARLQAIATEAAEQTGRLDVPDVHAPQPLDRLLEAWEEGRSLIFCDEAGDAAPMLEALAGPQPPSFDKLRMGVAGGLEATSPSPGGSPRPSIRPHAELVEARGLTPAPAAILIGPEGGFDPAERARLRSLPLRHARFAGSPHPARRHRGHLGADALAGGGGRLALTPCPATVPVPNERGSPSSGGKGASPMTVDPERPLEPADLAAYLASGCKPKSAWRVGAEHEKFGFRQGSWTPVSYDGDTGIRAMLEGLTRFGWKPIVEAGHIIGLLKDGASVSLEPGGQFELSGAPLEDMHAICAETGRHLEEVRAVADELGMGFIGLGFSPLWRRDEVPVMPKGRYDIMRAYMPKKGALGLDMMLRTCTVQSNHDFADEADMAAKFRVSLALQPVATALFANSPFVEGRPSGLSVHARQRLDRHRSGPHGHAGFRLRRRLRLRGLRPVRP